MTNYFKLFIVSLLVGVIIGLFIWVFPKKAEAVQPLVCICHNWLHNPTTVCAALPSILAGHGGHLISGFDKWGACVVPTPTPEPVYHSVCREYSCVQVEGEGESICKVDKDCEPEASPTPEPYREPAPQPCNGCGGEPVAPTCTGDPDITVAPINFFIERKGVEAIAKWIPTGGSEANLYYKEVDQKGWTHAVRDEKNDGDIVVGGLNPKLGYTFGLQQRFHCGDGMTVTAVVVDGPSSQIFRVSEYLTW